MADFLGHGTGEDLPGTRGEAVGASCGWPDPDRPAVESLQLPTALNAISTLLADPDRLRQYGQAARDWANQHFTWRALARQVVGVYRELLGSSLESGKRRGVNLPILP